MQQTFVRGHSRSLLDSRPTVACNPLLDCILARLIKQFFARWTASLRRAGILQKGECTGNELETGGGIENRRAERASRVGRSKAIRALPGLERLEPVSTHLLREGE